MVTSPQSNPMQHLVSRLINPNHKSASSSLYRRLTYYFRSFVLCLPTSVQPLCTINRLLLVVICITLITYLNFFRSSSYYPLHDLKQELRIKSQFYTDTDLKDAFHINHIHKLSNFQQSTELIQLDANLADGRKALITISSSFPKDCKTLITTQPSTHRLASLLNLQHLTIPSHHIFLPLPLPYSLTDRQTARQFLHAFGYKSPSKVPFDSCVSATIVFTNDIYQRISLLHMPAIEPYDWQVTYPTSVQCNPLHDKFEEYKERKCQHILNTLLIVYIAGCVPISNMDIFAPISSGNDHDFVFSTPRKCFDDHSFHTTLSKDILLKYLQNMCRLPSGFLARLKAVSSLSWAVGTRARELLDIIQTSQYHKSLCADTGWLFYEKE